MAMTTKDVAEFMLNLISENGVLHQEGLADTIKEKFGDEFVFMTTHGTLTIDRIVLREFNKLKDKDVVWNKEERCWE